MPQPIVQVDAFTAGPFGGNPAAVCILAGPVPESWMQSVAAEMNLSETAFLWPEETAYRLRWFTPAVEVRLCGHATLASAHVLWEDGHRAPDRDIAFETLSGRLGARRAGDWIELDFPVNPVEGVAPPPGLADALAVTPRFVGRAPRDQYLIEIATAEEVRALRPDFGRLAALPVRSVIVTAEGDAEGVDFVSRFFAPALGIPEDPVTGSAHTLLTPHWAARLDRRELAAHQVSARGGRLRLRLEGDRVAIAGQAVTVLRGELVGEADTP
jgi:predicted PhzF superfamily epimerase YddE/YHI9